jgi:multicomponent K+:H+ antiporter subunit D
LTPDLPHLISAPVVLPLLTAALMLLLGEGRRRLKALINVVATGAGLFVALAILGHIDAQGAHGVLRVYLASNWEAPFGIVLVADRLAAFMLVLVSVVSLGSAVYSMAAWSRAGVFFNPLFQIQLMGLNGAFLTGDLFNLFVFFEVLLAASYGLHLHGSGWPRVRSGLHYIAVNLLASALFLVGLAMLYGVMGTLSMADIATKLPSVPATDRGLLHAGAAILAVAFLTKAAIWPLSSWLVPAYAATSAPVAALFALMTKVGVYTLLRLSTLLFSADAGPSAHFGADVLLYGGLATGIVGALGLMASLRLARIAGFSILVSSGTLLAAIGIGVESVTASALFYLMSATPAASALFLLVELVERPGATGEGERLPDVDVEPDEDTNLDDDQEALVGRAFPVSQALLGLAFIASALNVAGLPPLSGFVAKVALTSALLSNESSGPAGSVAPATWAFFGLLLVSGLTATVSLARAGIRYIWSRPEGQAPRLTLFEGVPVLALIVASAWLTVRTEPVMHYARATAAALHSPAVYIDTVLSARPIPGPARPITGKETAP